MALVQTNSKPVQIGSRMSLFPLILYDLHSKQKKWYKFMKNEKGIQGLHQAGILANKLLHRRLAPHGYFVLPHTPGLWRHVSWPIQFKLVVDDFGVEEKRKNWEQKQFIKVIERQSFITQLENDEFVA